MPKTGYHATRRLRTRAADKRGGQEKRQEQVTGSLIQHRDRYLDDLASLNYRPSTLDGRRLCLGAFIAWAHERDLTNPQQITRTLLESYRRHLSRLKKANGKPLGVNYQRDHLSNLKDFFRWLCKQSILEANPASEIELPRPERPLPAQALSIQEVESILAVPDVTDPLGVRDRAILELFYSTAMRRSEVTRLEMVDLNLERSILHLRHTKGRKDRVVPIGERALHWLMRYLDEVRPRLEIHLDTKALFLTSYGEAFNPDVLSRRVSRYIKESGITQSGSCHIFRHSCATHLLEGGADIRYIQQLLGHQCLDTTAIYTEVSITQLQEVHRRCHPAGKKPGRQQAHG